MKKVLSFVLALLLLVTFSFVGCAKQEEKKPAPAPAAPAPAAPAPAAPAPAAPAPAAPAAPAPAGK